MTMFRTYSIVAALLLTTSFAAAQAGDPPFDNQLVTISCDVGSQVTISYTDENGNSAPDSHFDTDNNGEVEFAVPDYVTAIAVTKFSDGRILRYTVNLRHDNVTVVGGTVILR